MTRGKKVNGINLVKVYVQQNEMEKFGGMTITTCPIQHALLCLCSTPRTLCMQCIVMDLRQLNQRQLA
jgi:hypothetical protein